MKCIYILLAFVILVIVLGIFLILKYLVKQSEVLNDINYGVEKLHTSIKDIKSAPPAPAITNDKVELDSAIKRIEQLEEESETILNAKEGKELALEEADKLTSEKENVVVKLTDHKDRLEEELRNTKQDIERKETDLLELQALIDDKVKEIEVVKEAKCEVEGNLKISEEEFAAKEEELIQAMTSIAEKVKETEVLKAEKVEKEQEVESLNEKIKQKDSELDENKTKNDLFDFIISLGDDVRSKSREYKSVINKLNKNKIYIDILNDKYVLDVMEPITTLFDKVASKQLINRSRSSIILPWNKGDYNDNLELLRKVTENVGSLETKVQQIPDAFIRASTIYEFTINGDAYKNRELAIKLTNLMDTLLICVKILEQGMRQLPKLSFEYSSLINEYSQWSESTSIGEDPSIIWIRKIMGELDNNNPEGVELLKKQIEDSYRKSEAVLDTKLVEAEATINKTNKLYFSYIEGSFIKAVNGLLDANRFFNTDIAPIAEDAEDKRKIDEWTGVFEEFEEILKSFMSKQLDIYEIDVKRGDDLNFDIHKPYDEARFEEGLGADKVIEVIYPGYKLRVDNKSLQVVKTAEVIVSK